MRKGQFKKGQISWNKDRKIGKILVCQVCKKDFYASPSKIKRGAKYCSRSCMFKDPVLIKKLSDSHIGQIPTNLQQLREINIGHKVSEETRRKISESKKGWHPSEEAIEKNRLAHLGKAAWNKGKKMPEISGEKHPMFGKTHSKESIRKMSESHKRTMASPEFRKKLSDVHKMRLSNPEERKRQSEVSRKTLLSLYESGSFPKQTNTFPERKVKEELLKKGYKQGIDFIHQYKFMNKFMCDFCFPEQKIIVEIYGDFWHANPRKYPTPIHKHQMKGIGRDKSKEAYIRKADGGSWTYLVLWESDIKKDVARCVDKIEEILKERIN